MPDQPLRDLLDTLDKTVTRSGETLTQLCGSSRILLVFLRHAGCTFCREALGDLAQVRDAIEGTGTRIVLVDMGDSPAMEGLVKKYGLSGVDRISDPDQLLYRAFGLKRGNLLQLFGPKVLWRGLHAAIFGRHGIGRPSADGFQMPGLFLLDETGIARRFRHKSAADRPDYSGICASPFNCGEAR